MSEHSESRALAEVLAEHRAWHVSQDAQRVVTVCRCGGGWNRGELHSTHEEHVVDALLASPQFARLIAEAEARALREARTEISRMLDTFPQRGRHTRARWAVAWLDQIIERRTTPELGGGDQP